MTMTYDIMTMSFVINKIIIFGVIISVLKIVHCLFEVKMSGSDKLKKITKFNTKFNKILGTEYEAFDIYMSKGLKTHLIKQKHYIASKYVDKLNEIIESPDYIGNHNRNIEIVKVYKENIFISIKLDEKNSRYFVATMFDVKKGKIDAYINTGRLKNVKDFGLKTT